VEFIGVVESLIRAGKVHKIIEKLGLEKFSFYSGRFFS
jgi:hypothetical protein